MLLAVAVAGPVGAVLVTVAVLRTRFERAHPELLAAWYERIALAGDIDDVTRLADTVAMGRALQTTQDVPRAFSAVMSEGTLADRQTALGLIARQFSPSYAPALRAALVGGEPLIRVQAAAVAVKIRAEIKTSLRAALHEAARLGAGQASACAQASLALRQSIDTGLLDDDDKVAGEAAVVRLVGLASAVAGIPADDSIDHPLREHLASELLRQGKFAAFRALRQPVTAPPSQVGEAGDV